MATTYVLKNHNGKVLAEHTDVKKLADEMLKYEAQTGNRTLIEVRGSGKKVSSLKVPANTIKLAEKFMAVFGLKGKPEVLLTPTMLTFIFPNWLGTVRDLENAIEKPAVSLTYAHKTFTDNLSETLDNEQYVLDYAPPKFSVRGTDAVVTYSLHAYDPDEDSAF